MQDTALLITLIHPHEAKNLIKYQEEELIELAKTAGIIHIKSIILPIHKIEPSTYLGSGKVEEIAFDFDHDGYNGIVIFNNELSGTQTRNLQDIFLCNVLSRTELILDIFALHASSSQAKLQVEMAQAKFRLPRLRQNSGKNFSRTGGGIGTRGPGEKQLEIDRRHIEHRIHTISNYLKKIENTEQNKRKKRKDVFNISLVGYTNSGKSTLLNALTKENIYTQDALFATLDTTTRKLFVENKKVTISDTVGFIQNLPEVLLKSFHSTLETARFSDLLLLVLDASSPFLELQLDSILETLEKMDLDEIPLHFVLNKIDKLSAEQYDNLLKKYPESISVSATKGTFLENLKEKINDLVEKQNKFC